MAKRLLIVEEALRDLKAHWFEYIKTITKAAEGLGWRVIVAGHTKAAPEIKSELEVLPVFNYARYLDHGNKKLPGERHYGFILHSLRSLKVLWPLFKNQDPYDEVFVPTVMVHHLLAWQLIMKWHPNKPKHTTLFFVTNPGVWNASAKKSFFPKSTVILKWMLQRLQPFVKSGLMTLAVETEGAKNEFETLSGLPFKLLPHPVPVENDGLQYHVHACKGQNNSTVAFGCYGFARHEKGSDLLKKAIEQILTETPDFNGHFTIQWTDTFSMPDGSTCEPGALLRNYPKVRIIDRAVGSEEYQQLLSQTDCMVLPYRNTSYHARVSRIAIEAATSGIPMIYTKHGWLEETVANYGAGIGIEDEYIGELIEAIYEMAARAGRYRALALEQSGIAKQYYSPINFFKKLVSISVADKD